MINITDLSPEQLRRAASIKEEIQSLEQELQRIVGSNGSNGSAPAAKKGGMSDAGRARIAAAARARWAKVKAKKSTTAKPEAKKKRVMSAAARAKIAAAAKDRWAERKKATANT